MNRTEQTMLSAAMDFCRADEDVRHRRSLFLELQYLHSGGQICYLPIRDEFGNVVKKARPEHKWCEHCRRLPWDTVNYTDAKHDRRSAKARMKRAYKRLTAKESQ
jgi:hypothetical protein